MIIISPLPRVSGCICHKNKGEIFKISEGNYNNLIMFYSVADYVYYICASPFIELRPDILWESTRGNFHTKLKVGKTVCPSRRKVSYQLIISTPFVFKQSTTLKKNTRCIMFCGQSLGKSKRFIANSLQNHSLSMKHPVKTKS